MQKFIVLKYKKIEREKDLTILENIFENLELVLILLTARLN